MPAHVGSGRWGVFDAGVRGWHATDLSEDAAHQQAAEEWMGQVRGADGRQRWIKPMIFGLPRVDHGWWVHAQCSMGAMRAPLDRI